GRLVLEVRSEAPAARQVAHAQPQGRAGVAVLGIDEGGLSDEVEVGGLHHGPIGVAVLGARRAFEVLDDPVAQVEPGVGAVGEDALCGTFAVAEGAAGDDPQTPYRAPELGLAAP